MRRKILDYCLLLLVFSTGCVACSYGQKAILPGDCLMSEYMPLLQNKRVALLVNRTSEINGVLLPDTLLKRGINVVKIFSPEHGFRGLSDAGAVVENGKDKATGLPVVSLYGKNKKPTTQEMSGIDVVVYDIQDVGARFYTYISTLQYMMEACAAAHIPLIILDRPDPVGWMVDGPILDTAYRSFVGMQPIPMVYGMTPGEYARMLIGEHWLNGGTPQLTVIPCKNYTHHSRYALPVAPSPNLKTMTAIYLYPSLCLFEGTAMSVGRGTQHPFQMYGHPDLKNQPFSFVPKSMPGATHPKFEGKICQGVFIARTPQQALKLTNNAVNLKWLLTAYREFPNKTEFFNHFFNVLAGGKTLQQQIKAGTSWQQIRKSWQPGLRRFKAIRRKYLIYPL